MFDNEDAKTEEEILDDGWLAIEDEDEDDEDDEYDPDEYVEDGDDEDDDPVIDELPPFGLGAGDEDEE